MYLQVSLSCYILSRTGIAARLREHAADEALSALLVAIDSVQETRLHSHVLWIHYLAPVMILLPC